MNTGTELLESLPVAVYTTDANGVITFFNEAAAKLWGHRPELESSQWCGSLRLYWPDGRPMRHDECPMAIALKEGRIVRDVEAVLEKPDGTRVPFIPYPTPLRDSAGRVTGAVNLLIDITDRQKADFQSQYLAAIVSSSNDAIISKTLDGRITSWNEGAEHIFGYTSNEMIGQPITRIIPPELLQEEKAIIEKVKAGERVEHFDTVRARKDGRRIDISLTVSPLRDKMGKVIGASKVARDITERKQSESLQRLLIDELNHRVKNTLATIQAIARQSLGRAASPGDFVESFNGRVQALARAHDLLIQGDMKGSKVADIVRDQVLLASNSSRIRFSGPHYVLDAKSSVQIALVLHELATNARKYGALSTPTGRLSIDWRMQVTDEPRLIIDWRESGVPNVSAPNSRGFGTTLIERSLKANGGNATLQFDADGVVCRIDMPLPIKEQGGVNSHVLNEGGVDMPRVGARSPLADLRGKRILLIEDEAIIAMDVEEQLSSAGCEVIGPAETIESALRHISDAQCDAALVDANLAGNPVDELAAALTKKNIPFIFATGYGREGLPRGFQDAAMLTKPLNQKQLVTALSALLSEPQEDADVVQFQPNRA